MADAGRTYQRSFKGALKHSFRQKEYRKRQAEKVTHHGSRPTCQDEIVCPETQVEVSGASTEELRAADATLIRCDGCGRLCGPFARQDFLGRCRLRRITGGKSERFKSNRIRDSAIVSC